MKKILTAAAIAGMLILGGAAAANAETYPPEGSEVTVSSPSIAVGGSVTISVSGLPDDWNGLTVTFAITGGPSGASLSSLVFAAGGAESVDKTVADGSASAQFTASAAGSYVVSVTGPNGEDLGTVSVSVAAASGGGGGLPPTGGAVPTAAIWLGVGAVGLGGIAIAAAAVRRRARSN